MTEDDERTCEVEVGPLGERLSALRLMEREALDAMRRSLEAHRQLTPLVVFRQGARLEILDGFKRAHAARALGWRTLRASVTSVSSVEAKLRLRALHEGRGLTELEEAWLVRSLHREDGLTQPEIARLLQRHKSWVWRRLMLVESLDAEVQTDVRLGLIAPRAAVAVSRLPRGNQRAASAVVMRRGLTVRQTEQLVEAVLDERDPTARAVLLARRLEAPAPSAPPGPRPSRARSEVDRMSADILRMQEFAVRLEVRLSAHSLETFTPAAAEMMREALVRLVPVLRALERVIAGVTSEEVPR